MGSEEGLKWLCNQWDELEKLGYVVDLHVKIKSEPPIHPDFWGKTGKIFIDDPREGFVDVNLDDRSCVLRCSRNDYIVMETTGGFKEENAKER